MSLVGRIISRIVTLDHKGKTHEVTLDSEASWETVLGIVKLIFNLESPFSLSFGTKNGAQLQVQSHGQLCTFLKSKYDKHILYINHSALSKSIRSPKNTSASSSQKDIKALRKPSTYGETYNSATKGAAVKKEYNTFDLMEEEKERNKNEVIVISSDSSGASASDSELSYSKDPYTAFHEELSSSSTFDDQPSCKSKDPLEQAQELQNVLRGFITLFNNNPSVSLPSEILIDQVLEGVDINIDVFEKSLQRHSIAAQALFLINNSPGETRLDSKEDQSRFPFHFDSMASSKTNSFSSQGHAAPNPKYSNDQPLKKDPGYPPFNADLLR